MHIFNVWVYCWDPTHTPGAEAEKAMAASGNVHRIPTPETLNCVVPVVLPHGPLCDMGEGGVERGVEGGWGLGKSQVSIDGVFFMTLCIEIEEKTVP